MEKTEKTIYDLKLHETLTVEDMIIKDKKYEITRVPGGFLYALEYPGWRQTQVVFVPFNDEFNKK